LNRPEYNLETSDIEGTKPNAARDTMRTKRVTDPLDPKYKLPIVEQRPPTPPKFLRDAISIDVLTLGQGRTLMELNLERKEHLLQEM